MITDLFERYRFSAALLNLVLFSSSATCPWSAFCEIIQSKSNQRTVAICKESFKMNVGIGHEGQTPQNAEIMLREKITGNICKALVPKSFLHS